MNTHTQEGMVYPVAVKLAGCLTNELASSGLGGQCFSGVVPGGSVAYDYCTCGTGTACGGMAWVRLGSFFPSTDFPIPDTRATCATKMAYRLEVGVVRCIPTLDSRGNPPTMDQQLRAFDLQMADMAAIRLAIACCMRDFEDTDYILENYTPIENQGGCGGGFFTVLIEGS